MQIENRSVKTYGQMDGGLSMIYVNGGEIYFQIGGGMGTEIIN